MRWLCLDPGTKRTGLAISDPEGKFALPLSVIAHGLSGLEPDDIAAIVVEHRVDGIVIGLPVSMDGTHSEQTQFALGTARRIAERLGWNLQSPGGWGSPFHGAQDQVVLWDERLTTFEARRLSAGEVRPRGRRKKPERLDAHAAAVILQSFLDANMGERHTGAGTMPDAREETPDGPY